LYLVYLDYLDYLESLGGAASHPGESSMGNYLLENSAYFFSLMGREDILFEQILVLELELGDDHNTDNGGNDDIFG